MKSAVRGNLHGPAWLCRFVLFLAATLAMVAGCQSPESTPEEVDDPPLETITADLMRVERSNWPLLARSQGSLFADEQAQVGAKVAGRVEQVHVDLGDFVSQGDPLVTLDRSEFRLQVAQAEAQWLQACSAVGLLEGEAAENLDPLQSPPVREARANWDEAKSVLERATKLDDQEAISQGEFELAKVMERVSEARYSSAINGVREKVALIGVRQAELSLARQRLADAVIVAPLDGYVQQRSVAPGGYVAAGQPIAVLVRTHPLRFRGTVPERYAQALSPGQQLWLSIESVTERHQATISRVSPALDQRSRALLFEADIANEDHQLRTGLFVEAEVVLDPDATAIVIPPSAIVEFAGTQKVWRLVDGVAEEHEVLAGPARENGRPVLKGLVEGDVIFADARQGRVAVVLPSDPDGRHAPGEAEEAASQTADGAEAGAPNDPSDAVSAPVPASEPS